MKTRQFFLIAIFLGFCFSAKSQENKKWIFELNAGPSWDTESPANADLSLGLGFEGVFTYAIMPHTSAYVGWGWNRFGSNSSEIGQDFDFEETGYILGLQFKHPISTSSLSWFVRGGAIFNHLEVENSAGELLHDTKHGLGWQLASGLEITIYENWFIRPQLKYHNLDRSLTIDEQHINMYQSYFSFRLGIAKTI